MNIKIILLLVLFYLIGYTVNVSSENIIRIPNEKLEEFEENISSSNGNGDGSLIICFNDLTGNIIIENNEYKSESIDDNMFNKIGQKVENVIDKSFNLVFKILKGFVGSE